MPGSRGEFIDYVPRYPVVNEEVITTGKTRNPRGGTWVSKGEDWSGGVVVRSQPDWDQDELRFVQGVTRTRRGLCARVCNHEIIRAGYLRKIGSTAAQQQVRSEFHSQKAEERVKRDRDRLGERETRIA